MSTHIDDRDRLTVQTGEALDLGLPIAGIGSRSYAFIIDWHIRVLLPLLWLLLLLAVGWAGGNTDWWYGDWSTAVMVMVVLPMALLYFGYHPVLEIAMNGRTPGKRMAGVRIVDRDGHPPSFGALLVRNIFRLVDSLPMFYALGVVVCFLHPRQLRLGDLAAGTVLVREEKHDKRSFTAVTALAAREDISPRQQEILLDLLERWTSLGRDVRTDLAARLLQSLGEQPRLDGSRGAVDAALRHRLQEIAGGAALRR